MTSDSPYSLPQSPGRYTELQPLPSQGTSLMESPTLFPTNLAGDVDTHGSALLTSLIEFIRPTIVSQSSKEFASDWNSNVSHLSKSAQGQELLRTLYNFVNLVITSTGTGESNEQEESIERQVIEEKPKKIQPTESISANADEFSLLSNMVDGYYLSLNVLPSKVIETVKRYIFNNMPIRMISFDLLGTNCSLVERSELASIIIARIQAVYLTERVLKNPHILVRRFCKYAILSHTWLRSSPGDVLFHDWAERTQNARGNAKIANFCVVAAREHGVQLGWMDTVCINKESSTELDESILSMYGWYREAYVCIAYLADTVNFAQISRDVWFTRGWTLQELLANEKIYFYNRDWRHLLPGNFTANPLEDPEFTAEPVADENLDYLKMPVELQYQIFKATSITQAELAQFYNWPEPIPICRIMELAAQRTVTRAEDQIYSLMGLLRLGMSVAYGEGPRNALKRMVQQIMVSRKTFLDLFNHNNPLSILPNTITDYIDHAKKARNSSIVLQDPFLLSHLGVHATFLSIPVFQEYVYKCDFPQNIPMEHTLFRTHYSGGDQSYITLDNSRGTAEWVSNLQICLKPQTSTRDVAFNPPFIFLALLLSKVDQEHDELQISVGDSLGIPVLPDLLNLSDVFVTARFTDIKPLNPSSYSGIWKYCGPVKINLPYSGPNVSRDGILTLTLAQAKQLGFKVISGYFP